MLELVLRYIPETGLCSFDCSSKRMNLAFPLFNPIVLLLTIDGSVFTTSNYNPNDFYRGVLV